MTSSSSAHLISVYDAFPPALLLLARMVHSARATGWARLHVVADLVPREYVRKDGTKVELLAGKLFDAILKWAPLASGSNRLLELRIYVQYSAPELLGILDRAIEVPGVALEAAGSMSEILAALQSPDADVDEPSRIELRAARRADEFRRALARIEGRSQSLAGGAVA